MFVGLDSAVSFVRVVVGIQHCNGVLHRVEDYILHLTRHNQASSSMTLVIAISTPGSEIIKKFVIPGSRNPVFGTRLTTEWLLF